MKEAHQFPAISRLIHWLMAVMIIAMLFIGVGMVASTGRYAELVSIHRPLGIAILALVVVRVVNRVINRPPPLPASLPAVQRIAAKASHHLLYALMFAMPLIGWAMVSAAGEPVRLAGPLVLPPIVPAEPGLYAGLRTAHGLLAYLFFAVILVHLGAALFHGLVRRDGVLESMASVTTDRR
jgi:cytochrome b561